MWGTVQTYAGKETHSEVFKNHHIFDFHEAMDDIVPINDFLGRPARFFNDTGPFVKDFLVDLTLFGERPQQIAIKAINELIGDRIFAVNEMHYIILNYNIKSESGKHIEPKSNGGYLSPSDL